MAVFMVKMFIKTTGSEQEVQIDSVEQHLHSKLSIDFVDIVCANHIRAFLVVFIKIKHSKALLLSGFHNYRAFEIREEQ